MPKRLVTEQSQLQSFSRRALILGGAQAGVAAILAGRMAWLSIAENDRYSALAESNRVQQTLIPPRRGWIVDRHGRPIAINRTDFRVDLIPDRLVDPDHVIAELRLILGLTDDDVARVQEGLKRAAGFRPVPVAENLTYEKFAALSVRQGDLPGVVPASGNARFYPAGAAVAHLTGYVGQASAADYEKTRDPLLITPGFKVGKEGLERALEPWLRGHPGAKRSEVTARGRVVAELTTRPEEVGNTLQLTIDAGLQHYAARRLGTNSGSAVVIDVETGGILSMVSMPAYNPNSFSDGISHMEWDMLSADDHIPLMNKVLQGLYPPGSTVKPMNALALLEAGVDPNERVVCTGGYRLGNNVFHCHSRRGHGAVDMKNAVMQSCDIYFYAMIRRLGIDPLAQMMRRLGLGATYDLPYKSQRFGTVPDSQWKLKKYKSEWKVADTINASIGQGYTLVNPLQLAVMAARIASGKSLDPRLIVNRRYEPQGGDLGVDPDHLRIIREAMWGVVNGGGTGGAARMYVPGVQLAGKTGTAQVRRITMAERRGGVLKNGALPFKLRDHALFVCFAPADKPRYAAAIVLEHNGHTVRNLDTPLVGRDIMTYLFDPERAMKSLADVEPSWGGDIEQRMARQHEQWRLDHGGAPPPDAPPPPEDLPEPTEQPEGSLAEATPASNPPPPEDAGDAAPEAPVVPAPAAPSPPPAGPTP
ncbi:penicillin-binding protein 2 [Sphingomonas naphthae]|uniref:Penicillin-binding protein 2 n=1 Tax=Sphingomonas naphthae TaxID=1813468 RepID=A0ABY7TK44_9SPHN|nr:penicillin-binding protein 2 [Sphingomonas naphthae]WCT73326.1 penicillin-binding protein 2 [Sphingomonas naphthae]